MELRLVYKIGTFGIFSSYYIDNSEICLYIAQYNFNDKII